MSALSFLKEELKKIDFNVSQKGICQFTFKDLSLVDLLPFAATEQVFFFESKEEDFMFLGLGRSVEFEATDIQAFLEKNSNEVLVYQDSFEQDLLGECYLPEWSFIKKNGVVNLIVHVSEEYKTFSPSNIIFNLSVWESFVAPWISYEEKPESDEWNEMINKSTKLFQKKELEKIVLSRKKIFTYDSPIEIMVMFRELYQANLNSSHFTIFHQFSYQEAFISFTPERLFTLKGQNLETVSLAGSIARGSNSKEDKELELQMNASDKLTREHEIVTRSIKEKLTPIMSELVISPLITMKLPYIQHRQAVIKGVLKKSSSVMELIDLLHPTPAVGGIPQAKAREKILEIEQENRAYYAAPVGVFSKTFSEVAVGIRSAMIQGQTITVFGGAGIVEGSIAEEEWIETGVKMQPFIKVLNKSLL
jgi:menaquinone-specific isochorismate synthase